MPIVLGSIHDYLAASNHGRDKKNPVADWVQDNLGYKKPTGRGGFWYENGLRV
jgi:hypothetical protein